MSEEQKQAASLAHGLTDGWKFDSDTEGWRVESPSGDSCYLFNADSEHGQASGPAIREVFRQLVGDLHFHRHEALASSPQPAQNAAALRDLAQALAWQSFGECRGYSERLLSPMEALAAARDVLGIPAAQDAPQAQPSEHDIIAAFSVAGLSCDDKQMDNRKYSVRGQLAQLVNGARALLSRYGAASHEFDANDMQAQWNAGFSVGSAAPRPTDDEMWDQALRERDSYHDMADQLAAQIAAITGEEIGEHSSANDPWRNAMLAADEFIAAQIRKLCSAPAVQTAPLAEEDARPTGTLVGLGGGWIINPDAAQAAPLAAPTRPHQTTAHPIKEPYTLAEIEARIASHDYSAELLLLHAMELLRGRPGEDARPVAWEVTNDSFSFWTAVRKESRARDIADEQQRAGWPGAEVRPLVYATPQPSAQAAPAVPLTDLHKFYGVESDAALIAAQQRHIEKLQARMPSTPSLAPQRPREG